MKNFLTRANIAHVLMSASAVLIGLGISILNLGWGLASAGLVVGVYGYLLGAE